MNSRGTSSKLPVDTLIKRLGIRQHQKSFAYLGKPLIMLYRTNGDIWTWFTNQELFQRECGLYSCPTLSLSLKGCIVSREEKESLGKRILATIAAQEAYMFKSDLDPPEGCWQNASNQTHSSLAEECEESYKRLVISLPKTVLFCSGSKLFGLGPELMRDKDLYLAWLYCTMHPEKTEAGFKVIGQCHCENWMDGDLVNWREDEGDSFHLIWWLLLSRDWRSRNG